ncbi:hypothetical protein [Streptomyces sp. SudanB91_2054]|uniref:hypothetical protein n=1 Tax=Streptomyces sp. SudanB91_2054 TaxID=3035278 RepID=UPI0036DD5566
MTVAALRRLLDEINTQGGPDAARQWHLRLDDQPRPAASQATPTPTPPSTDLRAAIAELLRAGATYPEVREQLGVGSYTTIAQVRHAQGIPVVRRPRPTRSVEETYALYAEPYGDGHARWTGPWAGRMPQIQHPGWRGRKESALRVAFRLEYGREPVGNVRAGCGEPGCVAAGHTTDRDMRRALARPRTRAA